MTRHPSPTPSPSATTRWRQAGSLKKQNISELHKNKQKHFSGMFRLNVKWPMFLMPQNSHWTHSFSTCLAIREVPHLKNTDTGTDRQSPDMFSEPETAKTSSSRVQLCRRLFRQSIGKACSDPNPRSHPVSCVSTCVKWFGTTVSEKSAQHANADLSYTITRFKAFFFFFFFCYSEFYECQRSLITRQSSDRLLLTLLTFVKVRVSWTETVSTRCCVLTCLNT